MKKNCYITILYHNFQIIKNSIFHINLILLRNFYNLNLNIMEKIKNLKSVHETSQIKK